MSTTAQQPQPRRGRPAKDPSERKGASLKMRTREDIREKLELAAAKSGRSISEEAEIRLYNSFALESVHNVLYSSGGDAFQLMNSIATAVHAITQFSRENGSLFDLNELRDNPANKAAIYEAVKIILNKTVEIEWPKDMKLPFEQMSPETKEIVRMRNLGRLIGSAWTGRAKDIVELMVRQHAADN